MFIWFKHYINDIIVLSIFFFFFVFFFFYFFFFFFSSRRRHTRLTCDWSSDVCLPIFKKEILKGKGEAFLKDKLAERKARHKRAGDSRYALEPNIKEGKGGLRDLQTLLWIARFMYRVRDFFDLVEQDLLTSSEVLAYDKAFNFLWTLRCHLHYLTGRAEERLTFDQQSEMAKRLGYTDHAGSKGVERLMKHYFLMAKSVSGLTRYVLAAIESKRLHRPLFKVPKLSL